MIVIYTERMGLGVDEHRIINDNWVAVGIPVYQYHYTVWVMLI